MPQLGSYPQQTSIVSGDLLPFVSQFDGAVNLVDFDNLVKSIDITNTAGILPLSRGGLGSVLSAPGSDQIYFYDVSAGSSSFLTIGVGLEIIGTVLSCTVTGGGGSGGAPVAATYITQLPNADLTNEFALSTLATGLLKNTTTTGVLTIAVAATDYVAPGSVVLSGLTQSAATLLGRTTTGTGAIEELTVDSTLTLGSGVLGVTAPALATLTWAATTTIDFTKRYQAVPLTGDTTFASSNLAAAREVTARLVADSSDRGLTFPGSWVFVGGAIPTTLVANKTALLTLLAFSNSDSGVVARYSVQS